MLNNELDGGPNVMAEPEPDPQRNATGRAMMALLTDYNDMKVSLVRLETQLLALAVANGVTIPGDFTMFAA